MQRRRQRLPFVLLGISLLLFLIAVAILVVPQLTAPSPGVHVTPTVTTTHLPVADATRLEKTLTNPDMRVQATALMPGLRTLYLRQSQPMIPPGSTISIVTSTSICRGNSCQASAIVTEKGGKATHFTLYLDRSTGQWLIAGSNREG